LWTCLVWRERPVPLALSIEVGRDSAGPTWNKRPAEYIEMAGIRPAIQICFCVRTRGVVVCFTLTTA
jgi:hypothetical protein